jgi:hypothetical protein
MAKNVAWRRWSCVEEELDLLSHLPSSCCHKPGRWIWLDEEGDAVREEEEESRGGARGAARRGRKRERR